MMLNMCGFELRKAVKKRVTSTSFTPIGVLPTFYFGVNVKAKLVIYWKRLCRVTHTIRTQIA